LYAQSSEKVEQMLDMVMLLKSVRELNFAAKASATYREQKELMKETDQYLIELDDPSPD